MQDTELVGLAQLKLAVQSVSTCAKQRVQAISSKHSIPDMADSWGQAWASKPLASVDAVVELPRSRFGNAPSPLSRPGFMYNSQGHGCCVMSRFPGEDSLHRRLSAGL